MEKLNLTNVWGIYKILNTVNGKFYIGSSTNLRKRLYEHYRELSLSIHTNKHLQLAWDKYGKDNFKFEILERIEDLSNFTNEDLRQLETNYIQQTQCYKDTVGYNIAGGIGTLNIPCSKEKKKKISEANKGKKAWNKGIAMSEEQKELLKQSKRKSKGKAVDVYTLEGEFLETLGSIAEVVEKYRVAKNTIVDQCKGRRSGKKFIFKYHSEEELVENNKNYIKNKTYDEKLFCIYDLEGKLLTKLKYKKDVVFYLTNSTKRNGNLERKLKNCVDFGESICLYEKYIVKFKDALNSGDIINESRQLNKDDVEGINIDANGEA
jgi:group I intron endonuclease